MSYNILSTWLAINLLSCLLLAQLIPFLALSSHSFWYIGKTSASPYNILSAWLAISLLSSLLLAQFIPFQALSFYNCLWYIGKIFALWCNILSAWCIFILFVSNGWCNLNWIYSYSTYYDFFHGLDFWDQWHLCFCLAVRYFHN